MLINPLITNTNLNLHNHQKPTVKINGKLFFWATVTYVAVLKSWQSPRKLVQCIWDY